MTKQNKAIVLSGPEPPPRKLYDTKQYHVNYILYANLCKDLKIEPHPPMIPWRRNFETYELYVASYKDYMDLLKTTQHSITFTPIEPLPIQPQPLEEDVGIEIKTLRRDILSESLKKMREEKPTTFTTKFKNTTGKSTDPGKPSEARELQTTLKTQLEPWDVYLERVAEELKTKLPQATTEIARQAITTFQKHPSMMYVVEPTTQVRIYQSEVSPRIGLPTPPPPIPPNLKPAAKISTKTIENPHYQSTRKHVGKHNNRGASGPNSRRVT